MFPLPPTIIAFGIANLPMLGWLAAAGAPILIHLLFRRKYREMPWAAMEYLLAALKRRGRRLRFEQWLLLAVRTLLIVLLVLAVAEPYLKQAGFARTTGGRAHRVLVIDASFSMAYKPTDRSRFDRAKQLAGRIVEESRQGDAFTLVLLASPPKVIIGTPALEPGKVLEEIDNLRCGDTTADLPATVATVRRIVERARRENPGLGRHEVYFLSDLQRVAWDPKLSAAAKAEFRRHSEQLAKTAALVVIDLGQADAENLAITNVQTLDPVATTARDVRFEVTLKDFSRRARTRQPVELLLDGRRVAQTHVDIPPGGEASAGFAYRFTAPGDHSIEVRASGDALHVDNHRFMAIPVRQSLRVLCIDGHPSGEPFLGASDYLVLALCPQDDRSGQGLVEVDLATESALLERDLSRYDCVFLCDVAQFTASEARLLDAYLRSGGNLVFFLGEGVLAERYNRELAGAAEGLRILPARLDQVAPQGVYSINPLEYRHPMVRAFRGRAKAGLSKTPIFRYYKLVVPKDSNAEVVLRTTTGDPLVVEERIHRGRVVMVGTSANTSWTPMPLWPSFVPLVQEMLTFCAGGELAQRNVRVGEPFGASISGSAAGMSVSVQSPDGRTRPVPLRFEGDYGTLLFAETTAGGIYTARFGPPASENRRFAVNVDTAESDLAPLTLDELRADVWPDIPLLHEVTGQDLDTETAGAPIVRSRRLHVGVLYVVLGLLFAESYLAWRFGHHAP